jgi:hypothetical protein
LSAKNWKQYGCPTCEINAAIERAEKAEAHAEAADKECSIEVENHRTTLNRITELQAIIDNSGYSFQHLQSALAAKGCAQ